MPLFFKNQAEIAVKEAMFPPDVKVHYQQLLSELTENYTRGEKITGSEAREQSRKLRCFTRTQVIARQVLNYLDAPARLEY